MQSVKLPDEVALNSFIILIINIYHIMLVLVITY